MSDRDWRAEVDAAEPWNLEPHYSQWVGDLTKYGLHEKADIATALAIQSQELTALRTELAAVTKDAERYRWLKERLDSADFSCGSPPRYVLMFRMDPLFRISANLDCSIDAAIEKERT